MNRVTATIPAEAITDVLVRANARRGNVLSSLPYVPGSAVRGHFAGRWIAAGEPIDHDFRRIFQSGSTRFLHAYPAVAGRSTIPVPMTARTCKTHPLEEGHLAQDTVALDGWPVCEHPDHGRGATKRVRGFVTGDGRVLATDDLLVSRSRIATVDDDEGSGLARPQALFTERRLRAQTTFSVRLVGDEPDVQRLLSLVDMDDVMTVGRARSVLGQLELGEPQLHGEQRPPLRSDWHTLTFLSDTVVLDPHQRSLVDLTDVEVLRELLRLEVGLDTQAIEILPGSMVRATNIGGWDGLDGRPKPVDPAVAAGSVIRFREADDRVASALSDAAVLGWRRAEGYGEIVVDHAVHRGLRFRPAAIGRPGASDDGSWADRLAQRAREIAEELWGQDVAKSRGLWQGVEATLRARRPLEVGTDAAGARHAQAASARGSDAGRRQRERRNVAIERFLRECRELGVDTDSAASVQLADHIGRELDLLAVGRS